MNIGNVFEPRTTWTVTVIHLPTIKALHKLFRGGGGGEELRVGGGGVLRARRQKLVLTQRRERHSPGTKPSSSIRLEIPSFADGVVSAHLEPRQARDEEIVERNFAVTGDAPDHLDEL